jgi:hypothetical protein
MVGVAISQAGVWDGCGPPGHHLRELLALIRAVTRSRTNGVELRQNDAVAR